ncbi:hypothetical protein Tco_0788297 [Tanacetum coccineum]
MVGEDKFHDDNPPPPPPVTPTQQAPHTVSTIKLPILKKGKYDIWAMKMEHYLGHTDYPIWEIIQKRERKARTTLLMAIPEDHLAKFHKMTDAKEIWEAIKSRFGGNDEAKKIQKYILKQQFESFSVSNSEGLHKGYDRFQSLLSQLEIHDAGVSTQDANQKFSLSSLPTSWNQLALTRPRLSASIAITHGTLLESADQKEIKKVEEEMQGILDIKQNTMGGDLENMRNLNLCNSAQTLSVETLESVPEPVVVEPKVVELTAIIDGQEKTITEASLRRHLKLEDNGGVTTLPNSEIFEQLALMGYATDSDKLTFQKGNFSPQWRFFIHTILHCLSPKKTAWEQFSSNIATAIICLATTRTFNFSKFIFDAMVKNLDNPHKFLMYPRFIQICLNKQRRLLQPHTRTYSTPVLTQKVFSNMKRVTKGYSGEDIPLFASMITASETSPSRITSSPSLSPQHTPFTAPSTSQPSNIHTTPVTEEAASMPHESPLQSVHSLGRDEGSLSLHELTVLCTNLSNKVTSLEAELAQTKQTYGTALTKLIKKVKKLEQTVKTSQSRRRTRVVLSDEKEVSEDPSKQGRSLIEELDLDAKISLVPPHDVEIQKKISNDTEVLLEEEETAELVDEPTELVEDQGSGEKGEQEVTTADTALNTASVPISTASATYEVSTAAENLVYIRRSAEKRKDKGKAIMIEDESVQKKSKKKLEQERLSHEEAIRIQEHINEEERKKITRDAEIAKQLQEEYDKVGKKEVVAEVDTTHVIDWNDPSVIRYHALQNRPRSVAEVRKNMLIYLKNQGGYKMKDFKGMSYDDIRLIFEKLWDQVHSFVPMDSEEEVQRLKRTDEKPKTDELSQEQLNQMVIIVPDEGINVEALQTKYPIIGWEVYSEDTMQFWKIIRVGNHIEVYQVFEDMLKNFDRDDLVKLWSLVQERYNSSRLTEDKEIELWVELKMLFEPDAKNLLELQKYMHDPLK